MTYRQVGREIIEKDNGKKQLSESPSGEKANQLVFGYQWRLDCNSFSYSRTLFSIWCQSYGPTNQWIVSNKNSKQITYSTQSKDTKGLPDVSPKDWKLLLVNRDNKSKELNPELANVYGVSVDARIAKNS